MTARIEDTFPECMKNEHIACLSGALLETANISDKGRRIELFMRFPGYISGEKLQNAELVLRECYKFSSVRIVPRFAPEHFSEAVMPDMIMSIKRRIAPVNGSFTGCRWEYDRENGVMTAHLAFDSRPMLSEAGFEAEMKKQLGEVFGVDCDVKLEYSGGDGDEVVARSREAIGRQYGSERAERSAAKNTQPPSPQKRQAPAEGDVPPWESGEGFEQKKAAEPRQGRYDGLPDNVTINETVLGKNERLPIVRISELSEDYSKCAVWGKIFNHNCRESKSGKVFILSFDITDLTSSVTVKSIVKKTPANEEKLKKLSEGVVTLVQGEYEMDDFDHCFVLRAKHIAVGSMTEKTDTAEKKRVELHIHSNMSRLDAIPGADDIVKRASKWGHKAIALTDHGVLQGYPAALKAQDKLRKSDSPVKVLYGVEAYFVNDVQNSGSGIVTGSSDRRLDGRFIVFDLETTGLSPESERIIEIGAVIVENGQTGESFDTFVDPHRPISAEITRLTGISDDMVKGAPDEAEALRSFFEFCGEDAILVAHNAGFDTGFLNAACTRLGMSFENTYIDTLQLSKVLYPSLGHHRLDSMVAHFKLPSFNHHRACDDAAALAGVFIKETVELSAVYGVETVDGINSIMTKTDPRKLNSHHMIILARNNVGLKNLYELTSSAHLDDFYKHPRILKSKLIKHREGLIIGSACEAGELYQAVFKGARWNELLSIASFYDYLEIQPVCNNAFMVRRGIVSGEDELRRINRTIVRLGEKLGKPVVATTDAHYLDPEDDIFRRILLNSQGMSDAEIPAKLYMRTTGEMLEEFAYLGEKKAYEIVVENTNLIADMIEDIRPVPNGVFPPSIEGSDDDLRSITRAKAKEIYGDPLPDIVHKRLERELDSIISHGYSVMYITAQRMVADSVEHGYLVGSRGSVGSSFVATMAGISEVNPLAPHYVCPNCRNSEFFENDLSIGSGFDLPEKNCPKCGTPYNRDGHDIPFETFLGFKGDKQPDIDLNFASEYQSQAHKFVESLFNVSDEDKVYKAGTIGTVAEKTAYSYVMKYQEKLGVVYPPAEIERLRRGCTGVKLTTGQHPGGMVVVPGDSDVYDFCAVQHPANKTDADTKTTHFDFHAIHDTILKLDCLGHVVPTIYKYLEDFTGIDVTTVPMSDPEVMSLFHSPEALGVTPEDIGSLTGTFSLPEVGTNFVRSMLIDTKPTTFADLLQVSGLSHGTGVYLGNAKDLIASGTCTISEVIGTRDNIMSYLIKKGVPNDMSFKIMEIVRKGNAKKLLNQEHLDCMREHGVPEWYIDSCYKIEYMFPKAHAAAYMIACLRLGWYKVHRPVEYYAAYFTSRCENFDAEAAVKGIAAAREALRQIDAKGKNTSQTEDGIYSITQIIIEAQARGIRFLPIDIYKSDAKRFMPEDGALRLPFIAMKGLGEAAAVQLAAASAQGPYISRAEIVQRAGVSKTIVEKLGEAGALGDMPKDSQMTLDFMSE